MSELKRARMMLQEMTQFGLHTYAERMIEARKSVDEMERAMPWADFNAAGSLKVQIVPTRTNWGFEMARVMAVGDTMFPDPPNTAYKCIDVDQVCVMLSGRAVWHIDGERLELEAPQSVMIPRGAWAHVQYFDAVALFTCYPHMALEGAIEFRTD